MRDRGLRGRVALVTGAGGGIGQAVVHLLREEGVRVAGVDQSPAPDGFAVDVRDAGAVERVVDEVERTMGPIDFGVNVAGILRAGLVIDTTDEDWDELFAVNTRGVFNVCRSLARRMAPRRRGSLVTVSSNAAGVPRHGLAAYGASKAAATMFTRALGVELAPSGIRCNVVAPGSTRTPMLTALTGSDATDASVVGGAPAVFRSGIPLGKIAEPADIAEAVVFLLSDAAGHITMAEWYVDGGASLHG